MVYNGYCYIIIVVCRLGLGFIIIIILQRLQVISCTMATNVDVKRGLKVDMNFDLAQPFKPFEQLMGVLPSRSRKLLPQAYRV
jgi:hypothetical protein